MRAAIGFGWLKRLTGRGQAVALILLLALGLARALDPLPLEVARAKIFDFYQQIRPREVPADRPVMIVDLDEASLAAHGQWPWPRALLAQLVDRVMEAEAVVLGFDTVFAEPDRLSPARLADSVAGLDSDTSRRLRDLPDNDAVFAGRIAAGRVVLSRGMQQEAGKDKPEDVPQVTVAEIGGDPRPWLDSAPGLLRSLKELDEAAIGHGLFHVHPEPDGIVRRVPALFNIGGRVMPSLAMELLRVATGNSSLGVRVRPEVGVEGVVIRPKLVRTDEHGRVWVYAAHYDPAKYIPVKDVLAGNFDKARLKNKIVLFGSSAAGLHDIRAIAVERQIPGVELHAQIIETVLTGEQLLRPADAMGVELSATLLAGVAMILLVPLVGARWTLLVFTVAVVGLGGFSWWAFVARHELYDPAYPILTAIIVYMTLTYAAYTRAEVQRQQVRTAFSRYMSPALVERLAVDPSQLRLGGEMRDMTLLFCDVRGFTTISEQFTAEGLTRLINRFLTPMTDVILSRNGTIDKYMGDCIMAFWNAPLDDPDHARNACQAALDMNARLEALNAALAEEAATAGRPHLPINIGIGLNSGIACVGNMGSEQRFDYSVLGDTVNLASRLEGQSKTYGVTIVIGEHTRAEAPDYATLPLDRIQVKGKTQAVAIYALLGTPEMRQTPAFQRLAAAQERMYAHYLAQEWDAAEAALAEARAASPELSGLFDLYAQRIASFRNTPPGENWDGVYRATSK